MAFQPRNPFGLDLETAMRVGLPAPQLPPQAPQEAPTAPKMGRGQLIAGILADALAGAAGQPGPFAARMARQQQQQAEEAQWHRRRQGDREDKQWEWQNKPKETAPYRFEDNAGNVWERGPDGRNVRIFTDEVPKQFTHDGMLITTPNPYAAAVQPAPPEVIGEDVWNTGIPVGGQASPAPGGFPRYR